MGGSVNCVGGMRRRCGCVCGCGCGNYGVVAVKVVNAGEQGGVCKVGMVRVDGCDGSVGRGEWGDNVGVMA